jgi:hypothetical protein
MRLPRRGEGTSRACEDREPGENTVGAQAGRSAWTQGRTLAMRKFMRTAPPTVPVFVRRLCAVRSGFSSLSEALKGAQNPQNIGVYC